MELSVVGALSVYPLVRKLQIETIVKVLDYVGADAEAVVGVRDRGELADVPVQDRFVVVEVGGLTLAERTNRMVLQARGRKLVLMDSDKVWYLPGLTQVEAAMAIEDKDAMKVALGWKRVTWKLAKARVAAGVDSEEFDDGVEKLEWGRVHSGLARVCMKNYGRGKENRDASSDVMMVDRQAFLDMGGFWERLRGPWFVREEFATRWVHLFGLGHRIVRKHPAVLLFPGEHDGEELGMEAKREDWRLWQAERAASLWNHKPLR